MINKVKLKFLVDTDIFIKKDANGNAIADYIQDDFLLTSKISKKYKNTTGNYQPTITLKRANYKLSDTERFTVEVEFCPAKLLYGNNLFEVAHADFEVVLTLLISSLDTAGFSIDKQTLRNHAVTRIDYSKIFISEYNDVSLIDLFKGIERTKRLKRASVVFDDESKMPCFYYENSRLSLYYKNKELSKDRQVAPSFKKYTKDTGLHFYRWEYNLREAAAIKRELGKVGLMSDIPSKNLINNTFEQLFDEAIAGKLLKFYLDEILEVMGHTDSTNLLSNVDKLSKDGKLKGTQNRLAFIGYQLAKKEVGLGTLKQLLLNMADKGDVYKLFKNFKSMDLPKNLISVMVRKEIEDALYIQPMSQKYITDYLHDSKITPEMLDEMIKEYEENVGQYIEEALVKEFIAEQKAEAEGLFPYNKGSNTVEDLF